MGVKILQRAVEIFCVFLKETMMTFNFFPLAVSNYISQPAEQPDCNNTCLRP